MKTQKPNSLDNFFVTGISYRQSDEAERGMFRIGPIQYEAILQTAADSGFGAMFVLSTCNRTEIYGFAKNADELAALLCTQTAGGAAEFKKQAYSKQGAEAVLHLYRVAAGLDSQILGDYEIVGQLRQAIKFAHDRGCCNSLMDRLTGSVLQASKAVKNETELCSGSVSVAQAAVNYIKTGFGENCGKKVLLIGTGKIGRKICKNLAMHLSPEHITLMNRTFDTARAMAGDMGFNCAAMETLQAEIDRADIIITAATADQPLVEKHHVEGKGEKLFLDLGVPANVDPAVSDLFNITLVPVDLLSKQADDTLHVRSAAIPQANAIIARHVAQFMDWYYMSQNAPLLRSIKEILNQVARAHQAELNNLSTRCPFIAAEQRVQSVLNDIAGRLRNGHDTGCCQLLAINEYVKRFMLAN